MTSAEAIRLTVREPAGALLDDRFHLGAVAPDGAQLRWRARIRDDDGRVWRASGATAHELTVKWGPQKEGTGPVAALSSLRPVPIDVRVEAEDGRSAARTLTRKLVAEGVRSRRWRGDVTAALHLPAAETPVSTLLIDATAGEVEAQVATLAAPLLASRGVLTLVLPPPRRATPDLLDRARVQLAAVPGAGDVVVLPARAPRLEGEGDVREEGESDDDPAVLLPPNAPVRDPGHEHARRRQVAWDALLARLGARARA